MASVPYEKDAAQRTDEDRSRDRERARKHRQRHRVVKQCVKCGAELTGTQKKYCSRQECRPKKHGSSLNHDKQCAEPGCGRPVLARSMCASHYSTWHRGQKKYEIVCAVCGVTAKAAASNAQVCSRECAAKAGRAGRIDLPSGPVAKSCKRCGDKFFGTSIYCDGSCREAAAVKRSRRQWSSMRRAFEDQDGPAMIAAIEEHVIKTDSGCWEWTRRMSGGYPEQRFGNKSHSVHRLSLEAKMGAPLGSQAAHHMCANTKCVNPDHLQPVTHRENIAEMLVRHSYLGRIAELESALSELEPKHPLLNMIPVK